MAARCCRSNSTDLENLNLSYHHCNLLDSKSCLRPQLPSHIDFPRHCLKSTSRIGLGLADWFPHL